MFKSKATLLFLLALLGALGYIVFTRQEISKERAKSQELIEEGNTLADKLTAYASLAAADSLFHTGNYAPARAAYAALLTADSLPAFIADLPERMNHAERMLRWRYQLDTLLRRTNRPIPAPAALLPTPTAPPPAVRPLPARTSAYDSLTLMLRQAERQILELRARVKQTTGPNYLKFQSGEGNETYYVGEISNGKANGKGVALLSTGSRYEGGWKNNQKHGDGEFNWSDGARYVGEYVNDKRFGQGTYYFPDGGVYVGTWRNGLRDGEGVFTNAKGKVVARGMWRKDELVE